MVTLKLVQGHPDLNNSCLNFKIYKYVPDCKILYTQNILRLKLVSLSTTVTVNVTQTL